MQRRNPVKAKEIKLIAHAERKLLQEPSPHTTKRWLLRNLLSAEKELDSLRERRNAAKAWVIKKKRDEDIMSQEFRLDRMRHKAAGIFGGIGRLAVVEQKLKGFEKIRAAKRAAPEAKEPVKEEIKIKTAAGPRPDENAIFGGTLSPSEKINELNNIQNRLEIRYEELSSMRYKKIPLENEFREVKRRLTDIYGMKSALRREL